MLIQEFLRDEPWKLLVACIMLNQTSAKQVHGLINEFFERWPNYFEAAAAKVEEMAVFIKPLGLHNRRAKLIIDMSTAYMVHDWGDVEELPGVGKYAADSYRIFCEGYLVEDVKDKELLNYVKWAHQSSALAGRDAAGMPENPGTP